MTTLMKPRTILYMNCRTCDKPWTYHEIDTDGNGPCCRQLSPGQVFDMEIGRVQARIDTLTQQNTFLLGANKSLANRVEKMAELVAAAQAWKELYITPGHPYPSVEHATASSNADRRLLAAIAAVEESK